MGVIFERTNSISDFFLVLGEYGNTYDHPGFFPVFKQPQILVKSGLLYVVSGSR